MGLDILMYHSVSEAGGPVAIPPATFAAQMQAIADSGLPVLPLAALEGPRPARGVVLTFDDGFADFARQAWPLIARRGWPVTMFLATGWLGRVAGWAAACRQPLMDAATVRALAGEGVAFCGHTVTHPDLTTLPAGRLEEEIAGSRRAVEDLTGSPAPHFAPPYGRAGARERAVLAGAGFRLSCGTRLARVGGDDPLDLPRVEMHYFRDPARLAAHLAGRGGYLALRAGLRRLRGLLPRG
jgi:peptidoglycan/xylan/chitin deacetylase (PgdA/CDA1 family)